MDRTRFDDLTRALAGGVSRRHVLSVLAGGLAAALGSRKASRAQGANAACDTFCHTVFQGREAGQCVSAAARGDAGNLCTACGADPARFCGGDCVDLQTDPLNCGFCGNDCSTLNDDCNIGSCNAVSGECEVLPSNENGDCQIDEGESGTCVAGACVSACDDGFSPCGADGICCPNGFCLNDTCVAGVCFNGSVGCNPGATFCVCVQTYAGPTICTPGGQAVCSAQRCTAEDPACPEGSYCIRTICDGVGTESGRCAPLGACPTNDSGCGNICVTGETCEASGLCCNSEGICRVS
jgi:hypothetical protein